MPATPSVARILSLTEQTNIMEGDFAALSIGAVFTLYFTTRD
jgi:hypothetical protein